MSDRLLVVGHSVAYGGGASVPERRYSSVLAASLGLEERNHAVGGAIACWDQGGRFPGDGGWEHVLSSVEPDPSVRVSIAHFGINDLPILGPDRLGPFEAALRTVIVRLRAGAVGAPSRWRRSTSFSGPSVDVVVAVEPSFDGVVSVLVDGSPRSFPLRGADVCDTAIRRRNGVTLSLGDLGEGSHSLTVSGGVDFVAWSVPAAAPPLVVAPIGHRLLDWSWFETWPYPSADADMAAVGAAVRSVVEEFGSPDVVAFDYDPLLDKRPELFTEEGVYPNDAGYALIAEGLAGLVRARLGSRANG